MEGERRKKGEKEEYFPILFGTDTDINTLTSYSKIEKSQN